MPSNRFVATAEALWRAAANAPLGSDDKFPESILMLVEVLNGPTGHTRMDFNLTIHANGTTTLRITDNGNGMLEEDNGRLLTWASEGDSIGHSKYGNGLKMFLAKLGDYAMEWSIETRVADFPEVIYKYSGPWRAGETRRQTLRWANYTNGFPDTGFRINAVCDTSRLFKAGAPVNAQDLLEEIKELICTRKGQSVLDAVDFQFNITDERDTAVRGSAPASVVHSSHTAGWRSLKQTLADLAAPVDSADYKGVTEIFNQTYELVPGRSVLEKTVYCCALPVVPGFPRYGKRSGEGLLRNHIFLEDTMIEAPDPREFTGKGRVPRPHFAIFDICRPIDPENPEHRAALPTPATAKVSLRRECPVVQRVIAIIKAEESRINALMTDMHVKSLEARIETARVARAAGAAGAAAVAVGGAAAAAAPQLPPASPAPEWMPPAEDELTPDFLRRLRSDEAAKTCDHYGLPKYDKRSDNILLLSAIPMTGEAILGPLSEIDLDDEENRLLKCLLHVAITKGRRI